MRFSNLITTTVVSVTLALACTGCTMHSTDSTEVGVLTRKVGLFGSTGIQAESYPPGDRADRDDIEFKTHDGNDIAVDVTVSWRVNTAKVSWILEHVGSSTDEVKENLVRPAARSIVRDVLNTMTSEEFYVADKKFLKAEEARTRLEAVFDPEGVIVERVILGEHRFHPEYEKVIHDKKIAEQTAEQMVSMGNAAGQEANRNLETARGEVAQRVAKGQGALDQAKLQADADFYKAQREAEAILAEKRAHAKGVEKQNQALAGAGGHAMVKLKIAEALMGKPIIFIPGGGKSGGGLQTLNINDLLSRYAVVSSAPPSAPEKPTAQ
jgi:regulator of protease activity HflC (stomatin/prohibitin superfamily)